MTRFVLLIRDDPTGSSWTLTAGASGVEAVAQAVQEYGGTVVDGHHYAVMGAYDTVIVADFPDEAGVLGLGHSLGSWGQYVEALRCYTAEDLERAREMADKAAESLRTQIANATNRLQKGERQ